VEYLQIFYMDLIGLFWPSSTVAAITPNRLYLIAKKDIFATPSSASILR
jgi:hypothetical protein